MGTTMEDEALCVPTQVSAQLLNEWQEPASRLGT